MEKFNEAKYKQQYNKEHYRTFKVDLKKEEFDNLEKLLKDEGLTKARFLRESVKTKEIIDKLEKWLKEKQKLPCGCGITTDYKYAYENTLDYLQDLKSGTIQEHNE